MTDSIFLYDGTTIVPTELARGPWHPNFAHGGAPAGLIATLASHQILESEWGIARIAMDLIRPVPLRPLQMQIHAQQGQSVLHHYIVLEENSKPLINAHIVSIRKKTLKNVSFPPIDHHAADIDPSALAPLRIADMPDDQPTFYYTAMDVRAQESSPMPQWRPAWFRLRYPLLQGYSLSPLASACAASDFGSGFSFPLPFNRYQFPNLDINILFHREPTSEWIHVQSHTTVSNTGMGITESVLSDLSGPFGLAFQTLLVQEKT